MPSEVLAALPGADVAVRDALGTVEQAWAAEGNDVVRASQLNLVLMLGPEVTPPEAAALFDQAVAFARRHPSRLVVLSERRSDDGSPPEAKAHVACFLDPARRGKRCCEALMLAHGGHSPALESLLSTWLEADLPAYLWCHRMSPGSLRPWVSHAARFNRIVADRSVEGDGFFALPWSRPEAVRDLAYARCLPVRQALGQFLSGHAPADLVRGLRSVVVSHGAGRRGEAHGLLGWMRAGLTSCAALAGGELAAGFELRDSCRGGSCLSVDWTYDNGNHFSWEHADEGARSSVALDYATSHRTFDLTVPFSGPEMTLGEALFF
jgi:hypothetical protein